MTLNFVVAITGKPPCFSRVGRKVNQISMRLIASTHDPLSSGELVKYELMFY